MSESVSTSENKAESPRRGRRLGTVHDGAYAVLIRESVLEEILEYSESDLTREVGGFLVGRAQESPRPVVEVLHFLAAGGT